MLDLRRLPVAKYVVAGLDGPAAAAGTIGELAEPGAKLVKPKAKLARPVAGEA